MSNVPAHSIFCCTGASPVLAESAYKIHNDPNRGIHDAICKSFMEFALRQHRAALLYALMRRSEQSDGTTGSESSTNRQRPALGARNHTTPTKMVSAMPPLTPPFTPTKKDEKGKGKEIDEPFEPPQDLPAENDALLTPAKSDSKIKIKPVIQPFDLPYDPLAGEDLSFLQNAFTTTAHTKLAGQKGITANEEETLIDMMQHLPSPSSINRTRTFTLPSRSSDLSGKYDAARLRSCSSVQASSAAPSVVGVSMDSATISTVATKGCSTAPSSVNGSTSSIHDHKMVIPLMPLSNEPTFELINNPLTSTTEYVMHLTSREDYGPVYSHRYFICPRNLADDWIELTLLQWFARGEPFKMKAEKWDIKCNDHKRFFRTTLRPNLSLRSYNERHDQ
jgi:hypothetical protein